MKQNSYEFLCEVKNCSEPAFVRLDNNGPLVCRGHYCKLRQINRRKVGVSKNGNDERVSG
jgi:hypothetical protein